MLFLVYKMYSTYVHYCSYVLNMFYCPLHTEAARGWLHAYEAVRGAGWHKGPARVGWRRWVQVLRHGTEAGRVGGGGGRDGGCGAMSLSMTQVQAGGLETAGAVLEAQREAGRWRDSRRWGGLETVGVGS